MCVNERVCVCGVEGRGEADAAGLPGEEAGVGEQIQPLSSTAGEPGPKDEGGSVAQPGAAETGDTRGDLCPSLKGGFLLEP